MSKQHHPVPWWQDYSCAWRSHQRVKIESVRYPEDMQVNIKLFRKKWNIADCGDMNPLQYAPDFVEVRAALKRNGAALRFTVRRSAFQLHWDSSLVKLLSRVLVDNGKGQRIQMSIQIDLPGLKSDETQEFIFGSGLCHLGASKHVLWEVEA